MKVEYKNVAVSGVNKVEDEGDGIVSAFVSITGLVDNVKDIIEPGAYTTTLTERTPKGVWGHQWLTPTSKTLAADELPPGHPDLPKELPNGQPWPEEAGALRIKMQFNLNTQRGREAYADVLFFGEQQEWSIGYAVPPGGATKNAKTGNRHIKKLNLYEYSPVLFGAMTHARTAPANSVKDAQLALKVFEGIDLGELAEFERKWIEFKEENADLLVGDDLEEDFQGDEEEVESEDVDAEDEDSEDDEWEDPDDEDEDDEEEKILDPVLIRDAMKSLETVLTAMGEKADDGIDPMEIGDKVYVEAKATEYEQVQDAVDGIDAQLTKDDAAALQESAAAFDAAWDEGDQEAAEKAATDLLDTLDAVLSEGGEGEESIRVVARVVADKMGKFTSDDEDEEEEPEEDEDYTTTDDEEDDEDEEEPEGKMGTYVYEEDEKPKKKRGKVSYMDLEGREFKNVPYAGRIFGIPHGEVELVGGDRMRAFVGGLKNEPLLCLDAYLDEMPGNVSLKSMVTDEIGDRTYVGSLTPDEVKRVVRTAEGARRFGLPIGSVIGGGGRMGGDTPSSLSGKKPRGGQTGRGGGSQRGRAEGRGAGNTAAAKKPNGTTFAANYLNSRTNTGRARMLADTNVRDLQKIQSDIADEMSRLAKARRGRGMSFTQRAQYDKLKQVSAAVGTEFERRARAARRGEKKPAPAKRAANSGRQPSPLRKDAGTSVETKRQRTQQVIDKLGAKGKAFKNHTGVFSYPIEDEADLKNAIKAFGRSAPEDRDGLKSYIQRRAKTLGCPELIPDKWNEKTEIIDTTEIKSLMDFVSSVHE